jgi:hypothetical protein
MYKFENNVMDRCDTSSISNSEFEGDSFYLASASMSQRSDSKSMSEDKQSFKIFKYLTRNTNKK